MKITRVWVHIVNGALLFVAGVTGGVWFSQHYSIVPKGEVERPRFESALAPPNVPPAQPAGLAAPAPTTQAKALSALPAAPRNGLFSYRFSPGEQTRYRLAAKIQGTGMEESMQPSGIAMNMGADMVLSTDSVDAAGNGSLRLDFEAVDVAGSFLGSPFELRRSRERTVMKMDGRTSVDTAQGQSTGGIPQLEFFDQPIKMTVAPDGEVLKVSGVSGFEKVLSPGPFVAPVQFDSKEVPIGAQWESQFNMPVPGLGSAPQARMLNTLLGYQVVNGRRCAVIQQELLSSQQGGQIASPKSAFGEGMQFSMPVFDVRGRNMVYFDVISGQLVRADMDFDFTLQIGQELKAVTDMMGAYSKLLQELEGGQAGSSQQPEKKGPLVDFGVNVKASMIALPT